MQKRSSVGFFDLESNSSGALAVIEELAATSDALEVLFDGSGWLVPVSEGVAAWPAGARILSFNMRIRRFIGSLGRVGEEKFAQPVRGSETVQVSKPSDGLYFRDFKTRDKITNTIT